MKDLNAEKQFLGFTCSQHCDPSCLLLLQMEVLGIEVVNEHEGVLVLRVDILSIEILHIGFLSRWRFSALRLLMKSKVSWFLGSTFSASRPFMSASSLDRGSWC